MKHGILLLLTLSLMVVQPLSAQQTTPSADTQAPTRLSGRLVSGDGQSPIVGATITLANQNISTTTNESGEFSLTYLEPGDEEVIIEADGYISDIQLVQLRSGQLNELGTLSLSADIAREAQEEVLLNLSEMDLNDDEGKTQSQASASSASKDVFNTTTSFAWSNARYRSRGYEQRYEQNYIQGLSFNTAERGQFNFSSMGGLNDATRYKEVVEGIEANNFTFGSIGKATNYLQSATHYAQGFKVGIAGTNRNYKGAARATYSTGLMESGWAVAAQIAWRYSPYIDKKGIIGEGIAYNSFGYFLTAEKQWSKQMKLSLITFGNITQRGQSAAVTQEVYNLTNQYNSSTWGWNNYNPYWGYQNGQVRNSRIVKSYDPTVLASFDWNINEVNNLRLALGYHYAFYSNSALTFFNAPDPRPDYYRNLPSFLYDGQLSTSGNYITKDMNGKSMGQGFTYNGTYVGPSVDMDAYSTLTDLWTSRDDKTTQIDWDALYAANYAMNANNPQGQARYIQERRHNDIAETALNAVWSNTQYDHLKMTLGLDAKVSQGIHYKTIDDLLGANQWYDIDAFADRDIMELASNIGLTQTQIAWVKQNDLAYIMQNGGNIHAINSQNMNDHFGYDYHLTMANAKLWFQNEWSFNAVDFYYALQLTYSSMQRTTNMINGRAWYLALLNQNESKLYLGPQAETIMSELEAGTLQPGTWSGYNHHFIDPAFKLGVNYKINGRNHIKLNAIAQTTAPLARDAYISPRIHDRTVETILRHDYASYYAKQNGTSWLQEYYGASEKSVGGDLTYEFNYPIVRGRLTGFYSQFWDGTELNGYYDDEARTFVNQALTGIDRRHMGVEAAVSVKLGTMFTLTGVTSVGDYRYTDNAYAISSAENGMALASVASTGGNQALYELRDSVLIRGLHVATGPQINASLKLSFFHPKMWFADITVSYFDKNYLDFAPTRRMKSLFYGTRADGTTANGSYVDSYVDEIDVNKTHCDYIQTTDGQGVASDMSNVVYDENGVPDLKYPYNLLSDQESLVSSNVLNRFLVDFSLGKLIYLKNRQSLSINLTVNNLLNNVSFKTGGYQQARLPRQTKQGEPDGLNSVIGSNVWKYPSKYYYAWGTNFYLNIQYKF